MLFLVITFIWQSKKSLTQPGTLLIRFEMSLGQVDRMHCRIKLRLGSKETTRRRDGERERKKIDVHIY